MLALPGVVLDKDTESCGNARVVARQVGADFLPTMPSVDCLEQYVASEIKNVRIHRGEHHWLRAVEAIFARADDPGADVLHLPGPPVELSELAAVQNIRMQRIRRDVAVLFDANGMPIPKRNRTVITAAGNADRAALLLRAIHPVGELIVRGQVINLRRRLVVPGAPSLSAVHGHHRPLVGGQQHDVGMIGIDPGGVIVVAAGRTFDGREFLAAVRGLIRGCVTEKDRVPIFRMHANPCKIGISPGHPVLLVDLGPVLAGIVRAIDSAGVGNIDGAVHAVGIRRRDGNADAPVLFRKALRQFTPGIAAVFRFVQSAARTVVASAHRPRRTPRRPQRGVDFPAVARIKG